MTLTRTGFATLILTVLFFGVSALADVPAGQRSEVDHLIAYLEHSDCVMIRNGNRHAADEAAEHARRKYEHFRDTISSTEEFVARAATQSLISGRVYRVQCPGEEPVPSAEWLLAELDRYRQEN
ncbi:MAG: DUF5329 family protein [Xanthomonadales bacterium]|nr:DUF5329 domain-containing protein [Gammaproteobacteria bacterium]MBT8051394.1 DUF5329 domain-containing protein [Gammaproteobacteria bacterium]MBT8056904.1 DUF5329 domain-containing protein [Gammaproteobacteria bacterium]NNJ78905.1 DUF5329 family protein [Xanthomonadales bacterium]NNL05924.1 DUF5329 family protein [Xanthomonadales bacterium]